MEFPLNRTSRAALLCSAFAASLSLGANAQARVMTPEDVANIEYAGTMAISRDGSSIAYTRVHRPDVTKGEKNGSAKQQLFIADGPEYARAFLPESMAVSGVEFSPDGGMISFIWTKKGEDRAVWGIPVNGGAHRKLATVKDAGISAYEWGADSRSIAMLVAPEEDETREDEKDAGFDAVIYEEEQRFNRMFIAAYDPAGGLGNFDEIDENPREVPLPFQVDHFDIAPGGEWMLVTSAPSTLVDDSYTAKQVQIVDLATGNVTLIVDTPGKIDDVEISPDGTTLSLLAATDKNDPAPTTLHLVDVATGEYRALNAGASEAAVDTEWMADGRLAVIVHIGAQSVLRFYSEMGDMVGEEDPDGLILTSLSQGGNRLAVRANAPSHPSEMFMYDGGFFTRWTDHNAWLATIDFGVQRTVKYLADDGQEIEGILIEPVGGIPFERAPTIMNIHGGPESHDSNGWLTGYNDPGQVAAGEGYAVFHPNYRGSTAYGSAFSKAHSGNYTDPEFTDILAGKYALAEAGITDPERVGITGGSYGGYATAWSSTALSAEYAAGVMFVGISNQISKFGTTDIPWEMRLVHSLEWPWEDWQGMLEESPIFHAGKAETPLLILHGKADPRVSPTQSYEMYRAIKIQRPETPLRLVLYPGEGHGNSKAAARYDYNLRMMEWFDTYLKTGDRTANMPDARPDLPKSVLDGED